ncbi:MAG TPA: MBL fold metallo-hydrolase [Bryobacteraceae bacterium]|nr:MBL fold metallo-hydrolase [Bryobacteraceae bacterium]
MRKTSLLLLALAVILSAGAWMARTQAPQAPAAPLTIEKVKDNLYAIIGDGGNVAVYVTDEGLIVVDDKFERDYAEIMAKIRSVTDKPVRYVLNTHQHGDHTGGNQKMLDAGVEILAQQNARANMVTGKQPGLPRVTFTAETSVFLGGREVRARYFGRGHTNGDAMIYFPDAKVLHTGDLFVEGAPLIDYNGHGSAAEWVGTLDGVLHSGWDFDVVIPGHGKVSKPADLVSFRNNFERMRNQVTSMLNQGRSKDDIARMLAADFTWPPTRSVDGIVAELRK